MHHSGDGREQVEVERRFGSDLRKGVDGDPVHEVDIVERRTVER